MPFGALKRELEFGVVEDQHTIGVEKKPMPFGALKRCEAAPVGDAAGKAA
jgi:hypothetical protein